MAYFAVGGGNDIPFIFLALRNMMWSFGIEAANLR